MLKNCLKIFFISAFILTSLLCCRLTDAFAMHTGAGRTSFQTLSATKHDHDGSGKGCSCFSAAAIRSKARNHQTLFKIGDGYGSVDIGSISSTLLTPPSLSVIVLASISAQPAGIPLYIQYRTLRL